MMKLVYVYIGVLLWSSIATANEYIVRTDDTAFYKISATQLLEVNIKQKNGSLKLQGQQGEIPYVYDSKKYKFNNNEGIIFFAETLQGKDTYQHPLDDFNGFSLFNKEKNNRYKQWQYKSKASKKLAQCTSIRTTEHYEKNKLLIRINTKQYQQAPELWYWQKLSHLNKKGISIPVDLSRLANKNTVQLTTVLRSTNVDRAIKDSLAHHEVQIKLNGKVFQTLNWNDKLQFTSTDLTIPAELINDQDNVLTFVVPKRKLNKKSIIDIVMLDYFKLTYDINPQEISVQDSLSSNNTCKVLLKDKQIAYAKNKQKYAFNAIELNPNSVVHIGNTTEALPTKLQLVKKIDNNLAEIDYVMITHPLFIQSIAPLADFYRNRGQNVRVVDINHIYSNYSHGIRELYALKDFIKDIYTQGQGRLQHVLLVGDSSWDWRDSGKSNKYGKWANRTLGGNRNFTNFPHQKSYTKNKLDRNFIPTGQFHSAEGHSASDNWFVSIVAEENMQGEDYIPDVAVGRFPASTPAELDAMVAKTINYYKNSKVGPWKSRVLWITNAQKYLQNSSKRISKQIGKYGVMANQIFPQEMDGDNLKVQETLTNSMNSGDLIVHFLGHGGKSIWRIGPPDLNKNRDLFTLDHVSGLKNSKTLPFVMSMSCYSAPFDHPFADSIGEKFIREPEVGAVAVFASSWRNAPNSTFSKYIIDNIFSNPNNSIGQAILAGKRQFRGRTMVEMYNLLGDPALHLAVPTLTMTTKKNNNTIKVNIDSQQFNGKAKIEMLNKAGTVISSNIQNIKGTSFTIKLDAAKTDCTQGRIYAWDSKQNIDAMAGFECTPNTES